MIKAKVSVDDTKRNLNRSLELFPRNLISASDRDSAQTAHDSALAQLEAAQAQQKASEAQLDSAKAKLEAARAQIKQAEAELELAQVNLDHTKITAPVNGIVISRNVDVGQTVAASLQAPTLFTIAQDLTEMQVDTNVSEADIGQGGHRPGSDLYGGCLSQPDLPGKSNRYPECPRDRPKRGHL